MVIDMNETKLTTIGQIREFLAGTAAIHWTAQGDDQTRYAFIRAVLARFDYPRLARPDKGLIRTYLERTSGYSRAQLARLIRQYLDSGRIIQHYTGPQAGFARTYTDADVRLLAEIDALHGNLSGPATCHLLRRAFTLYGEQCYARLAHLSVAHLYNLRKGPLYGAQRTHFSKTRSAHQVRFGERRAPTPDGRPGFIRIDTVHQGDLDGIKGLYHINAVDCVTQWQLVATCERISEAFLLPVIELLLAGFPFAIRGFHSDGGSEFVNQRVATMLDKLNAQFTRSRPAHCNDNALVETKNGAVVRKHFGYSHISQRHAAQVNAFCSTYLNPYLNLHRPCLFATDLVDPKGKRRKRYKLEDVMTPFEKLKSLPEPDIHLKPEVSIQSLQTLAQQMTDNQAAKALNEAKSILFQSIFRRSKSAP